MLMIFWYSLWYPHQRDQNMPSFLHSFWVFYNQTKREQLPSCYQVCSNVQTTIIITFPIQLRTTRLGSICLLSNAGWITGICTTKLSSSYRDTLAGFASLKSWIISPLQTEWVNSCMNYSFNQHNLSEVCIKIRMGIPVLNIKISKCGAM